MSDSIPPEPRRGIAAALRLIDAVRHIAYDPALQPADALRRIRDAFLVHDESTR